MDCSTIKRRTVARMSDRSNVEDIWNLIERFICPFRADLFGEKSDEGRVDWRRREIFDSTAIDANSNLAAHIHGAVTNPNLKWFTQVYQQQKWRHHHEAKEWLEECDSINYQSIQESNFDLEANEIYLDLTSFGGGSMSSMPDESDTGQLLGVDFKTFPVDECYFDFDIKGHVINFYRVLQWTADQCADKFGANTLPEKIKSDFESPDKSNNKHKIIFCIYKRPVDPWFDEFSYTATINRPYGSKYVDFATATILGQEGGHHEMPIFAPRWRRVSGSDWGFSPSMIAIWDVLTLNQMNELLLVAGEKVLDPTLLTTRKGVFGDIDLSAGGTVVVQDLEKSMKAFESRARFDVTGLNKQDLIRAVQKIYFVDELQLKESPAMTAAEVHARIQLMQRLLGPTFGRLHTHFLNPVVSRQFKMNFRYKRFPPMPPALAKEKADLRIEYLGSLAKAQKMDKAQSVEQWMGTTVAFSERFPQVLDIPNVDEVVRDMAENHGVPTKLQNSRIVVTKQRKIKQKQMAEEQEILKKQAQGDAAKSMGEGAQAIQQAGAPMEDQNAA